MSHSRSRISDAQGAGDVATRVHLLDDGPRIDVARMRDVFARARSLFLVDAPRARASGAVHRLYWGREGQLFSRELRSAPGDFAVAGRHSRCDLRLLDAEVSLRHALVQGTRLRDGRHVLRILDLRAALPFHLADDEPRRSIVATGPVVARIGRWVLVAFPLDGSTPPPEPPPVEVADVPDLSSALRSNPDESSVSSRISVIPASTVITELPSDLAAGDAAITVTRGHLRARVAVRAEDLERGVLIGRASRCLDAGIRDVLDTHISRAHLLLLSEGPEVFAYDLCSTNGTHVDGRRVRTTLLSRRGAELQLGRRSGVAITYRQRSE